MQLAPLQIKTADHAEELFKRGDTDRDGRLSAAELTALLTAVSLYQIPNITYLVYQIYWYLVDLVLFGILVGTVLQEAATAVAKRSSSYLPASPCR